MYAIGKTSLQIAEITCSADELMKIFINLCLRGCNVVASVVEYKQNECLSQIKQLKQLIHASS